MISFKATLNLDKNSLGWDYTLTVPNDIADQYIDNDRRVICTINKKVKWHCALMPDGNGIWFLLMNLSF